MAVIAPANKVLANGSCVHSLEEYLKMSYVVRLQNCADIVQFAASGEEACAFIPHILPPTKFS